MKEQAERNFTQQEHETWKILFARLNDNREHMAHPVFLKGLNILGITGDRIPSLNEINKKLFKISGWQGVLVEGLEEGAEFYPALANRRFPIGNFIRDQNDLNYTPAPDIFHDLYGHIPFYADQVYADACADYCARASKYKHEEKKLQMFERFFWFTYEFGLVETPKGRRIFGGGILSSFGESNYALSDKPKVIEFDIPTMIQKEFRIDVYQETLFILKNPEQLYDSNAKVEKAIQDFKG